MEKPRRRGRRVRAALHSMAGIILVVAAGVGYWLATLYPGGSPHSGHLALVRATVLVGEELEPRAGTTVLVRDGVVVGVGMEAEIGLPAEARVLDLSGYTLMPGLVDVHVHLGAPELGAGQEFGALQMPAHLFDLVRFVPGKRRALLGHGVTTVRSLGDEHRWVLEMRRLLRCGELEGPRLYAAGPIFTTAGGHPVVTIGADPNSDSVRLPTTSDAARRAIRDLAGGADPVDLIKVVQERGDPLFPLEPIALDVLHAIVDEAHRHDIQVVAHWGTREDLEDVIAVGVDGLEHLEVRNGLEDWGEIVALLVDRGISITPSLGVLEAATRRPGSPLPADVVRTAQRRIAAFHAEGGRVLVGSDAGMPGVPYGAGVHREMELLVESGLSPQAALVAATSEAARALRSERIGVIATGRAADLVVVEGDPLGDIRSARNVVMVFRDGRLVVDRRREREER
jgi:imidazolonepropionase-like amidohydrolase